MSSTVTERPSHAWGERPSAPRPLVAQVSVRHLPTGLRDEDRATLQTSAWFAELPTALQDAILGSARVREVEAGDTLARRGDIASAWIGVASGALRLGTSLRDGRDFTLDFISPGQWFGDIALMDDRPLDLDVTAHVRSRLLLVTKTDLQRLISLHDELANALLQLNCQRLRHMFRRFEEVQMLPLAQRLARQLQRLVHQFGRATGDGMCVDLALSQTDLAAIVGGSRQRVNRALRQMHLEGIVRLGEQRLMVPDEQRLADIAKGRLLLGNELSALPA
jgi:CRP/FNR family transcriptional regulator, cyclic AMP receptor protein